MQHVLNPFIPVCDAIALLLAPRGEVVLHDLKTNTIHYIANCFSKRQAGDDSLNDLKGLDLRGPTIGPYTKVNWNGRRLKSVSSVLRGQGGSPIGLLCINHDVEGFAEVLDQIASLIALPDTSEKTGNIFPSDWRERINQLLADFTDKQNITLAGLTSGGLNDLIAYLDADGVFEIRNATQYLAKVLNVSRATLYNRLRKTRDEVASK
jgi:D-arginine utilization repressor